MKHVTHNCGSAHILYLKWHVESSGTRKHIFSHVGHIGYIPAIERLIEHGKHIDHYTHIPVSHKLIENDRTGEYAVHGRDVANIPAVDNLVETGSASQPPIFLLKHLQPKNIVAMVVTLLTSQESILPLKEAVLGII